MSSIVKNINIHLICASNLLPQKEMNNCFISTIEELNLKIVKNKLVFANGQSIKLTVGERIVLHTDSRQVESIQSQIDNIRNLFNKRATVAQKNYLNELNEQAVQSKRQSYDAIELQKLIDEIDKKKAESITASKIQQLPSCEALVEELKISAVNKGYEVIQTNVKDNIQLQFVRRQY